MDWYVRSHSMCRFASNVILAILRPLPSHTVQVAQFQNKHFPHFEELCYVWGKDRATGKDAQSANDINEEIEQEPMEPSLDGIEPTEVQNENDVSMGFLEQPNIISSETTTASKRMKRRSQGKSFMDAINCISGQLEYGIQSLWTRVNRLAYKAYMNAKRDQLYHSLLTVHGLTCQEFVRAHARLADNEKLLYAFSTLHKDMKVEWIKEIID